MKAKIFAALLMCLLFTTSTYSQTLDNCIGFSPNGTLDCETYPQLVTPWLYHLPGPPASTKRYATESEAIAERISMLQGWDVCAPITYTVGEYDTTWYYEKPSGWDFGTLYTQHRKPVTFKYGIWSNYNTPYQACVPRENSDYVYSFRTADCNYSEAWNYGYDYRTNFCYKSLASDLVPPDPPTPPGDPTCQTCPCLGKTPLQDGTFSGNPILPATAEKFRREVDLETPGPNSIRIERIYRSSRVAASTESLKRIGSVTSSGGGGSSGTTSSLTVFQDSRIPLIGMGWSINLVARLTLIQPGGNHILPYRAHINFGEGKYRTFVRSFDGSWLPRGGHNDKFIEINPGNSISTSSIYTYQPTDSDEIYVFGLASEPKTNTNQPPTQLSNIGFLKEIIHRNGKRTIIESEISNENDAPRPKKITNPFGHQINFEYTTTGQIGSISHINPAGLPVAQVSYTYDSNKNLVQAIRSDGSAQQLHYESNNNPNWLTGYSLNGKRVDSYFYDEMGRATQTTRINGVARHTIDYSTSQIIRGTGVYDSVSVIDPLGTARSYGFQNAGNKLSAIYASASPATDGFAPIQRRRITSFGAVTWEQDFRGYSARDTTYDAARQLPNIITEGSGTRTQTITWHPNFRLPTQIDETGGKRTTFDYDDKGNLLRKTVTATSGTPVSEVWTWAYNAQGLMASETDPRGSITTYAYNSYGQLTSKTNPLGHVTTYAYSPAGLVSQVNEPTGLIRYMTYTPRGWLATSTLSAAGVNLATAYTYTVDGQIQSVALPNGHIITYQYDAALRNIGWSDNRGQSAVYTLDPAGNATEEQVKNNGGQVALQIRRTISALNRVQSETIGAGITETYTQDANGRLASVTDAAAKTTTLGRDGLERINAVTNAVGRVASLTYNAQDAVTQVIDFNYVTTNYARDVQGNANTEATPDAGTTTATYDALGLPSRVVDAIARATDITRDAFGRPTVIVQSVTGGKTRRTELRYDLTGTTFNAANQPNASKGRLCEMVDKVDGVVHATTQYQWDAFGRLTRQTQMLSSAIANHSNTRTTSYAYSTGNGKGQLATITYPSGTVLTHQYAANGLLTGMLWGGKPLLQNIVYNALDQPLSWRWEFGDANTATSLPATRLYNTAGQLTSSEFATFAPETTGRIGSVTQKLMKSNGSGGWVEEAVPFNALYDAVGQLTSFQAVGSSPVFQWGHTYNYGPNGNRTGGTITANGASMSFTSGVQSGTNRQSNVAGITVVTNAAGDITSLLGKTLAYDAAGQLSEATAVPPCPTGTNCQSAQTTTSRFNGWGQRYLRDTPATQSVFSYGMEGHTLLSETTRYLSTSALSTTEHIYLPTASGPMPVAVVINGVHYAVHSDHLNTPRRLTDANKVVKWQWPYSGFGEIAPQATPATGQAAISYSLRYPGQIDDGNGLFYNWHRFYDPRVGRYTQADPIGLEGGWNRFGYVGGNPVGFMDPNGLNPATGAYAGAGVGSVFGPVGSVVGGLIGAGVGAWIGWNVIGPMWAKPPENAYDPKGPKAPGKPGPEEGFKDPKSGENWVPNPNPGKGGSGYGWQDAKGDVWCPTGPAGPGSRAHGGPHWDVQTPGGGYRNERPRRQ